MYDVPGGRRRSTKSRRWHPSLEVKASVPSPSVSAAASAQARRGDPVPRTPKPRFSAPQRSSPRAVASIMVPKVISLAPEDSLLSAAVALRQHRFSGMPVVHDELLVGVLSEKDVLRVLEQSAKVNLPASLLDLLLEQVSGSLLDELAKCRGVLAGLKVHQAMTKDVVVTHPRATLPEVARLMTARGIHRVPVVEHGKMVGIVTSHDLLRVLQEAEERLALQF